MSTTFWQESEEITVKFQFGLVNVSIMLLLVVGGFAQPPKCEAFDNKVAYKVLNDNVTTKDGHKRIYLEIYVGQERFVVASMVKLVERIKHEHCKFDSIAVSIFDTKKLEKLPDPPPHPLIDWQSKTPPRGFYEYDRQSNTAELTFQEKRNSKEIDVEIIFRPDGYCVSEIIAQQREIK